MDIFKQENGSTCASRTAVLNHRMRSGKATAVRHVWTSIWLDVAEKTLMSLRLTTRNENVYFEHCPYVLIYSWSCDLVEGEWKTLKMTENIAPHLIDDRLVERGTNPVVYKGKDELKDGDARKYEQNIRKRAAGHIRRHVKQPAACVGKQQRRSGQQ